MRVRKADLIAALLSAASEIRELGCTCGDEERDEDGERIPADGHDADCTGHVLALGFERTAFNARDGRA